ncbi:UDP-N-acetyl-D-glucosamine dehydrogenase, partial [Patescibacteria group bacterium]|nr:UDP-N-acetyl-D-glucosamine dehydrogenase [Patescibacteria group bacterium]
RESAPVELIKILSEQGADILYNDPYVPRLSNRMVSEELDDELLGSVDCVVIATDHSCYDWQWIVDKANLVFDTRGATRGIVKGNIRRLGEKG